MPNLTSILAASSFAGFKNYQTHITGSGTIPSQALTIGGFASTNITIPLNNSNAVSTSQVQFVTVESFWHELSGIVNSGTSSYSIEALSAYTGGNLVVTIIAANETGSTITLPTQTINVQAQLYVAPF